MSFCVSNRTGLTNATTVERTEEQLMRVIPKKDWITAHHWLIYHGRRVCHARKPDCGSCALLPNCRFGGGLIAGDNPADSKVKGSRVGPGASCATGALPAAKPTKTPHESEYGETPTQKSSPAARRGCKPE